MRDHRAARGGVIDQVDLVLRIDGTDRDAIHTAREQTLDHPLLTKVVLETKENNFSSVTSNDIKRTNSSFNQPTQSLNDVLSTQPGCDVRDGKIFIKGSDQVRFFIDGEPVMGPPTQNKVW